MVLELGTNLFSGKKSVIRNKPKIKVMTMAGCHFKPITDTYQYTFTEDNTLRSDQDNQYFQAEFMLPNNSIIYSMEAKGSNTAKQISILESAQSDLTQTQIFGPITMNGTENKQANGRIINNNLYSYTIFTNDIDTNETVGYVKIKYIDGDDL